MKQNQTGELVPIKEFAKRTQKALSTIYHKIASGELSAANGLITMPNGRHRVDWDYWSRWLDKQILAKIAAAAAAHRQCDKYMAWWTPSPN